MKEGGRLFEYVKPSWQERLSFVAPEIDLTKFGASYTADRPSISPAMPEILSGDNLHIIINKLYYGGAQKRPDGNYCRVINNAEGKAYALIGESNRKDVRNAVEAAAKAQPGWDKRSGFNRSQILFYLAENLEQRRKEFVDHLTALTGKKTTESEKEVDATLARLFHWAAFCDKYGGAVQETQLYGTVLRIHEPLGLIGVACPDEAPLLGFVSLVAPAIARGNAVVVVPSEKYPTVAMALYQVLETSDLPGGVINILTGARDHITKYLAEHQDLQSMWYFGSLEGSKFVEHTSAVNVKRTWVNYGMKRDWFDSEQGQGEEFLYHSVQAKNIWLTMGDIFAN
ncbi:hypothetical protein C7M84_002802 [Penaeus vannamei]|uniref:Aldehyde dehydrogenase domain-containing protein n=1 Tax=Penaeus vannamei TaxID=6689 RepID=A0A423TPT8_PENVA|nr:hypothetical protein C7M84_002802 [Penaeus vannamei]